jgi:prepilin-type processing-associated H-X9-DG protein
MFYCPKAALYIESYAIPLYWNPTPMLSGGGGGGVFGYVYYAGWQMSVPAWPDSYGLTVKRMLDEPNRCVMGDILYSNGSVYRSSHPAQDSWEGTRKPEGGNFLYSDGSVRWAKCNSAFAPNAGWINDVFIDGQGWAISGKP